MHSSMSAAIDFVAYVATLRLGRWDIATLGEMAATYGTKSIAALIEECIAEARAP